MSKDMDFNESDIRNVAASLGVDAGDIMGKEPAPEPVQESEPEFIHEPSGKSFKSAEELYRYESGWKDSKYGEEIAKLRDRLEALTSEKRGEESNTPQPAQNDIDVMRQIWQDADEEVLNHEYAKFVYKGLKALDNGVTQQMHKIMERIAEIDGRFEEANVRSQAGIDAKIEHELLSKHPSLKALPIKDRVAVIAELAKAAGAGESQAPKPKRPIPQATPEDHVESSARNLPVSEDTQFDSFFSKYEKMDIDDQLSAFTKVAQKLSRSGILEQD